jgi:ABC-type nitrate/sulfonate/bicarbonate transport system substrate-binding protein
VNGYVPSVSSPSCDERGLGYENQGWAQARANAQRRGVGAGGRLFEPGAATAAPQLEKTDLNVAVVPALDSAGFFVALYGGLFKAEGLNLLPEPFASGAEEGQGVVPLADLNQGATTAFPIAGYVVTKQWAAKYPHTLAAFYKAIEEGQQIADTNRADVEKAMMDIPAPFGVSRQTAAVLALDSYPVSDGPVGSVDKIRLERVVNVMQQFIGFPKFNIDTMLMPGA